MTVKVTAVIAGRKVRVVIDCEKEDVQAMKTAVTNVLCNQMAWLTELQVSEG